MNVRLVAALALLALAACASHEDYGYARETRFDRPYRGGAAGVNAVKPAPESRSLSAAETFAALLYLFGFGAAATGHADFSTSPGGPTGPIAPASGR